MTAFYNEIDPFAAQWLRELIKAGAIANGVVDERSIEDITPNDLQGFTQCHFFAGIGVWSHALKGAGWSDDTPVWTGSCPCQPFSAAGKGKGFDDERHLWPAFHYLIEQCQPDVVLGEQVASKDGLAWFDLVRTDLEKTGYTCGAVDTCAAGFGAPHIRQRLYWVAYNESVRCPELQQFSGGLRKEGLPRASDGCGNGSDHRLANTKLSKEKRQRQYCGEVILEQETKRRSENCTFGGLGFTDCDRCQERIEAPKTTRYRHSIDAASGTDFTTPTNGFWGNPDWLYCQDGKYRPIEPSLEPLVDGSTNHVGKLRGYGNAIVAPQAQAFIKSFMESVNDKQSRNAR